MTVKRRAEGNATTTMVANVQTKFWSRGAVAYFSGEIMDKGEAERIRRLSENLYMSTAVDQISRPEWINQGGARVRIFSAASSTSNNSLLSSLSCSAACPVGIH